MPVVGCLRLDPAETKTNIKPLNFYFLPFLNGLLCLALSSNYCFLPVDGVGIDLWNGFGFAAYCSVVCATLLLLTVLARAFVLSPENGRESLYAMQPRWFAIVYNFLIVIAPAFLLSCTPLAVMLGVDEHVYAQWLTAHPDAKWAQANAMLVTLHGNNIAFFLVTLVNRRSLAKFWATVLLALIVGWTAFETFSLTFDMWPVIEEVGLATITMKFTGGGILALLVAVAAAESLGVLRGDSGAAVER